MKEITNKKPKDLLKEWNLVLWDLDEQSVIGAMEEFGEQCFEAGRRNDLIGNTGDEREHPKYKDFKDYLNKLYQ